MTHEKMWPCDEASAAWSTTLNANRLSPICSTVNKASGGPVLLLNETRWKASSSIRFWIPVRAHWTTLNSWVIRNKTCSTHSSVLLHKLFFTNSFSLFLLTASSICAWKLPMDHLYNKIKTNVYIPEERERFVCVKAMFVGAMHVEEETLWALGWLGLGWMGDGDCVWDRINQNRLELFECCTCA